MGVAQHRTGQGSRAVNEPTCSRPDAASVIFNLPDDRSAVTARCTSRLRQSMVEAVRGWGGQGLGLLFGRAGARKAWRGGRRSICGRGR